jgi:3-phosphoshikimate 1-carboxyvinyltransferase
MAMAIAGLATEDPVTVSGAEAIQVSFPGFYDLLKQL